MDALDFKTHPSWLAVCMRGVAMEPKQTITAPAALSGLSHRRELNIWGGRSQSFYSGSLHSLLEPGSLTTTIHKGGEAS